MEDLTGEALTVGAFPLICRELRGRAGVTTLIELNQIRKSDRSSRDSRKKENCQADCQWYSQFSKHK